ncbi:glucokinase [Desulfobulbus propionicus DSM 2032]|uniref:Glucokinase n=1 Tax=Desulfobulbus propionicus (strain ATCC 33891 / DSM 2032 / VKM B-1956 / 1pr3) TaxID=577650 RepID=A0A7U4DMU2_DESPD|nr:glucokinase [Desulfobulbus propionicus]ADW16242.1 glucokinase [Desulfobulbus propionicus DSM 2032]
MTKHKGLLLAGDIGATKTVLALYETWPGQPLRQQTFRNAEFASFDELVERFLGAGAATPTAACLGVAGPVTADTVRMTNLDWKIEAAALKQRFGWSQVRLINDLVATAMGALQLQPADCTLLNPGEPREGAVMAVLAPGSGLGEAFLLPHRGGYLPFPSEGGHASFAPCNGEQIDLLTFMFRHHAHVSVEQVCSGLAIPELFAFMATRQPVPDWLRQELIRAEDQTPVIVGAALAAIQGGRMCEVAVRTLELFVDILADEAANLALKTLALGGIFLGGGLAPRLQPFLERQRFLAAFARGNYRDMLGRIPVRIIRNPHTALLGAAACGASLVAGHDHQPLRC